ncbi:MAG: DUF922 domain-containing protein [Gammaproteobacteria bacterium]
MPEGFEWNISYREYEVTGATLSEVSANIFDLDDGAGFLSEEGNRRFAGKTEFDFSFGSRMRFLEETSQLEIQLAAIDWHCTVILPRWNLEQLLAAPEDEASEWRRFASMVRVHERGHFEIYHWGIREVRDALVDTEAGTITISASRAPVFDAQGDPATEEDAAIAHAYLQRRQEKSQKAICRNQNQGHGQEMVPVETCRVQSEQHVINAQREMLQGRIEIVFQGRIIKPCRRTNDVNVMKNIQIIVAPPVIKNMAIEHPEQR